MWTVPGVVLLKYTENFDVAWSITKVFKYQMGSSKEYMFSNCWGKKESKHTHEVLLASLTIAVCSGSFLRDMGMPPEGFPCAMLS